jgi:hypothetical protein
MYPREVPVDRVSNHSPSARMEEPKWYQHALLPHPVTISGTFGFSDQSRQQLVLRLHHLIGRGLPNNGRQDSAPKTAFGPHIY